VKRETLDILLRHRADLRDEARRHLAQCVDQTRDAAAQREQSEQRVLDERTRREEMQHAESERAASQGVTVAELQQLHVSAARSRAHQGELLVQADRAQRKLATAGKAEQEASTELGRVDAEHQATDNLVQRRRKESARLAELAVEEETQQTWSARSRR
jgi:ribosomal protein L3